MEHEAKARVRRAIDTRRNEIVAVARQIAAHPELGFKELRTAALIAERHQSLGLVVQTGLAVPCQSHPAGWRRARPDRRDTGRTGRATGLGPPGA